MSSNKKVTWDDVYADFMQRHPASRTKVMGYKPYDVEKIIVYCRDDISMIYDYRSKETKIVKGLNHAN